MSRLLIAEFDSADKALAAMRGLADAGINRESIDTYPSLERNTLREPKSDQRVAGAETPLSTNGPLGHLQSIVAKLFGAGNPDDQTLSSSEPTQERTGKHPAFLSVHLDLPGMDVPGLTRVMTDAGALRVAQHEM